MQFVSRNSASTAPRAMRRGFSVVELLVALALLGILAGVSMPLIETVRLRERERDLKQALWTIREALDAYQAEAMRLPKDHPSRSASGYPATLQQLVEGLPEASLPGGRRRFLRQLPRDPFADPRLPAAQTWGLRSYASEHDRPRPGDDVYDVYSQSPRTGFNGVPLRQW